MPTVALLHRHVIYGATSSAGNTGPATVTNVKGGGGGSSTDIVITSAADAPIPPPPPPPNDDRPVNGPRGKALCTTPIGSGHISYYGATGTHAERYEAVCEDPDHNRFGRCRLTRHPNKRPIGELGMFLSISHLFTGSREHLDELVVKCYEQRERLQWRDAVLEAPNGVRLASFERLLRPGEPIERND